MEAKETSYSVIVENDVTQWKDSVGKVYHFPRRYLDLLRPGTFLLHYKGKMTDKAYASKRLSAEPHYFAVSVAGASSPDPSSTKGDLFVEVRGFQQFTTAVPFRRPSAKYVEDIPPSRASNFWRDGVRATNSAVFQWVLDQAGLASPNASGSDDVEAELVSTVVEGGRKVVYSTRYERKKGLRAAAISFHGTACFACESQLGEVYGKVAEGYIHIHHRRPLSVSGETAVDPKTDLVPLCPTCHSIVHLGGRLMTVNQVRALLKKPPIKLGD